MVVGALRALLRRRVALSLSPRAGPRFASSAPGGSGRLGPDRVLPANSLTSTYPDGRVEIRFSDQDPRCQERPLSVWTMLNTTADRVPDRVALAEANLPFAQRLSLEMNRAKQLVKRKLFDMADYAWPFGNRVLGF